MRWYESSGNVSASTEGWAIWQDFRVENEGFKLRLGKMTKYSNIPSHPKGTDKDTKMSEDGKIFDPLGAYFQVSLRQVFSFWPAGLEVSCMG